jgi:hypothetical protein
MLIRVLLISLFLTGCSVKAPEFTGTDYARQIAVAIALEADRSQTRQIREDGRYEKNPVLGQHPSTKRIDTYFNIAQVGTLLLARVMPTEAYIFKKRYNPRKLLQNSILGVQCFIIYRNDSIGIKVDF